MAEVSIDMELFRRYVTLMGGQENIICFYPGFEQNPGAGEDVEDWSTNALHITNVAAYDDVPYIRGSQLAHRFNGADEIWEHADHDAFSMGADGTAPNEPCFTLGQWICPKVDNLDVTLIAKFDDVTAATAEYMLSLEGNGYPRFEVHDDSVPAHIGREYQVAQPLDEWAFIVGRYAGGGVVASVDVFLNGVAVDDADYVAGAYVAMHNYAAPFQVGCNDGGGAGATPQEFFQGDHWGAFLTDCVLPDANILELYRVGRRLLEI